MFNRKIFTCPYVLVLTRQSVYTCTYGRDSNGHKKGHDRVLGRFTTRRSGNSLSLTVPADAGVNEGQEYLLLVDDDGTLKYEPQRINPWHTKAIQKIDFEAMKREIGIVSEEPSRGKEV